MIGGTIASQLRSTTAVSNKVSARVWFENAPSAPSNPYIVVHHIFTERPTHLGGATTAAKGRYQINCYGITSASASDVALAVKGVFHTIIDAVSLDSIVTIESCRVVDERALYEPAQSNQNLGLFGQMVEIEIWYRE